MAAGAEGRGERHRVWPTVVAGLWVSAALSAALAALLPLGGVGVYFSALGLGGGGAHPEAVRHCGSACECSEP